MRISSKQYAQAFYAALTEKRADEKTVLQQFIRELRKARKMRELPAILTRVQQLHDDAHQILRVRLVTAKDIPAHEQKRIEEVLTARYGKKVFLQVAVDPTVLGGAAFYIGDTKLDATAQAALGQIHTMLTT